MSLPRTMRAVEPGSHEGKPVPIVVERPLPTLNAGEVLIKVAAAGLNRADLLQVAGLYPPPPGAPATLGLEASGHVVSRAPGASRWKEGDAVCVLLAGGGYAEYCAVDEGSILPVPKGIPVIDAAALPEAYFTVWTNIVDRCRLAPGETLLVHGGSSGIGTTAIQLFTARGHRVFATAGTAAKCHACKELGAARAINYREEDFADIIKAETGGKGVDVILDMVGGKYVAKNLASLAVEGRLCNIAYQEGAEVTLNLLLLMLKRLTMTGSTLRARPAKDKAAIAHALARDVWPLLDQGRLKPIIDSRFPLAQASEALARMASSAHIGKILLTV